MAQHEFRALDRIRVSVHGENAYRIFSPAADVGIRLRQISGNSEEYSVTLLGRDWPHLEALAGKYGLTLAVMEKQGPGHLAERLSAASRYCIGNCPVFHPCTFLVRICVGH